MVQWTILSRIDREQPGINTSVLQPLTRLTKDRRRRYRRCVLPVLLPPSHHTPSSEGDAYFVLHTSQLTDSHRHSMNSPVINTVRSSSLIRLYLWAPASSSSSSATSQSPLAWCDSHTIRHTHRDPLFLVNSSRLLWASLLSSGWSGVSVSPHQLWPQ